MNLKPTCSQTFSHFFRQAKGRLQTGQTFVGRFGFLWGTRAAATEFDRGMLCHSSANLFHQPWGWGEALANMLQLIRPMQDLRGSLLVSP